LNYLTREHFVEDESRGEKISSPGHIAISNTLLRCSVEKIGEAIICLGLNGRNEFFFLKMSNSKVRDDTDIVVIN
jgi:hypothetical protein